MEANIEATLTFYRLPRQHHRQLRSTTMLERRNEEIRRRTRAVRCSGAPSPHTASCLRLIRALAAATHEEWPEGRRDVSTDLLREHTNEPMRAPDHAA